MKIRIFVYAFVFVSGFCSGYFYVSHHPSMLNGFLGESEVYIGNLSLYRIGGCVCLYDRSTRRRTTPWVDYIFSPLRPKDSLTVFIHNGKRGYLNLQQSKVQIEAKYEYAWQFAEGIAAVVEDKELRFITVGGGYAFKTSTRFSPATLSELDFVFSQGSCIYPDSDQNVGLIDISGEIVVETIFSSILPPDNQGLRIAITRTGRQGVFNQKHQLIIDTVYDRIDVLENHGIVLVKNFEQQLFDFGGHYLRNIYDAIYPIYKADVLLVDAEKLEEMETGFSAYCINGRYGLYNDREHKRATQAIYDHISYHSPGIFIVDIGDFQELIDGRGQMVE